MPWFQEYPQKALAIMLGLPFLILPAPTEASNARFYSETMFETDFEQSADTNYDDWPDEWTRRRGAGFPHYVDMRIEDAANGDPEHSSYLRVKLDGGGAAAYSPPIEIDPSLSYVFQGEIKTEGLTHNVAYFTVSFFDQEKAQKETYTSEKQTGTSRWQELHIGPLMPKHRGAHLAVIGVHVLPTTQSDLTGTVMFDNLRFARLPSMILDTGAADNLYTKPGEAEITCRISGIRQGDAHVLFELLDVQGRVLSSKPVELFTGPEPEDDQSDLGATASDPSTSSAVRTAPAATATWRPLLPSYGFFTVRVSLSGEGNLSLQRTTSLSVLRRNPIHRKNEFGWSLGDYEHMLSHDKLVALLQVANVSLVKYPIWYDLDNPGAEGERIATLMDYLSAADIEIIGVLDEPPRHMCEPLWNREYLTAAEALLEPGMWHPTIDPLLVRYSLRIQRWQLGADGNKSFINYQGLKPKFTKLQSHMKEFGQQKQVGLAWQWMHEISESDPPPWDFLSMTESPPFTHDELTRHLTHPEAQDTPHWVTLRPLPPTEYDIQTRARDLVLRMTAAKINGTEAVFADNPCDPAHGLLQEDGTPGDLFLPWCITCRLIGGTTYLGSLRLPNGSSNHVFAHGNEATMVVWNQGPVTESIYLGDQPVQTDPWGRETALKSSDQLGRQTQEIAVRRLPTFVTGLDLAVALWRLSFAFEPEKLTSTFGLTQTSQYRFKNTFGQGVGGTLQLEAPHVWEVDDLHRRFKLGSDEEFRHDFRVMLNANASSGPQPVSVDFKIFADKPYHFKVYRDITVGLGDVIAEVNTWLDDEGKLIVEQHLINKANQKLDFDCYLFVPGRRRLRLQIFDVGTGRVTHTYVLHDGKELLGKLLWLRVEELNGERLYNYHAVAEP